MGAPSTRDQLAISVGGAALTSLYQDAYQGIRFLKFDAARPPGEQVIELTPAEPVRGRFVGPDGKPLDGVTVRGLVRTGDAGSAPLTTAEFTAHPPHPDRPRRLNYRLDDRKLVGTAVVSAGTVKPVEFKLEPWATVTGRLVDAEGKPIARASIHGSGGKGPVDTIRVGSAVTDAAGRFTLEGLLPGVAYELYFRELQPPRRSGPMATANELKPGETRDLGEIKVMVREP